MSIHILTYNELDHSLPACLPACRYQLTSNTITTAGLKKKLGWLFGQTSFQQGKFVTIIRFELLVVGCQANFNYANRRAPYAMCTHVMYILPQQFHQGLANQSRA
jgi:hypothetical protein